MLRNRVGLSLWVVMTIVWLLLPPTIAWADTCTERISAEGVKGVFSNDPDCDKSSLAGAVVSWVVAGLTAVSAAVGAAGGATVPETKPDTTAVGAAGGATVPETKPDTTDDTKRETLLATQKKLCRSLQRALLRQKEEEKIKDYFKDKLKEEEKQLEMIHKQAQKALAALQEIRQRDCTSLLDNRDIAARCGMAFGVVSGALWYYASLAAVAEVASAALYWNRCAGLCAFEGSVLGFSGLPRADIDRNLALFDKAQAELFQWEMVTANAANEKYNQTRDEPHKIDNDLDGAIREVQNWRNLLGPVEGELDRLLPPVRYDKCEPPVERGAQ